MEKGVGEMGGRKGVGEIWGGGSEEWERINLR